MQKRMVDMGLEIPEVKTLQSLKNSAIEQLKDRNYPVDPLLEKTRNRSGEIYIRVLSANDVVTKGVGAFCLLTQSNSYSWVPRNQHLVPFLPCKKKIGIWCSNVKGTVHTKK